MICEQETKTTCLFCEKERSLKPGCVKQRWLVCRDHLTVKCPVCGHFAFYLETKYGGNGKYVCFRAIPWCNWTSENPPVETFEMRN